MQGKGLIRVLFFLLLAVTLLQVLYILPTRKVEKNAQAYAQEMVVNMPDSKEKSQAFKRANIKYLDSMSTENIFSLPLLGKFTYDDLKKRQLALGLDLKGGMSAVLQIDVRDILENLSRSSRDTDFIAALDAADAALENSQSNYLTLFQREFAKNQNGKKLAKIFMRDSELKNQINAETSDGEVVRILSTKVDETVNNTFKRLKQRIDKLGVTQPNVSLDDARDLILVEMPGIDNPERARKFLQAGAALEFWETYRVNDPGVLNTFTQINDALSKKGGATTEVEDKGIEYDTIYSNVLDSLGNETGETTFELVEKTGSEFDNLGGGPLFDLLTLNNGATAYPATVIGVAAKNKRNAISELLKSPEATNALPQNMKLLWSRKPHKDFETGEITEDYMLYMIKKRGTDKPPLEGDVVTGASQSPNPLSGEVEVNLRMNPIGAKKWAEMTTQAANNGNREIAIALDDEVISAPRVNGPITGGSSAISGGFSVQEAVDFASILEVGKLPAKIKIIQESTVGPSLGKKNISSSIRSLLIGFGLLLLFMLFYYGGSGFVSIIALLLNLVFIFGALASYGTVLTLPGIAGIILTIGMAVDANVIIFERIREELRLGKSLKASIADGFKHSYSAIVDANVTTILVAIVLAYFGLGPIKGFAVVLIIGVLSSLFTAVLIGRMLIEWFTRGERNLSFWTGTSKNMFANLKIDWLSKRRLAYVVSTTIIVLGIGSIFMRGFDLGVDFKGGYSYNVEFAEGSTVDAQALRAGLGKFFDADTEVKAVDTDNTFNIVTSYLVGDNSEGVADKVVTKLHEGIAQITGDKTSLDDFKSPDLTSGTHVVTSSKVGPTIADDIRNSSIYAGLLALLLIFVYIFIRFNKWQYSLGAVAALFHDSMIVLSLFSIFHGIVPFSLEIDQAFIAALLTVIGYSINDTVVLFDRIREYLGIYTNKSTDEILNMSINSTFSRTIITSFTTFLMVLILFLFGGGSMKGFAFAILVGVIVGTYSSIFIATPIVRDLTKELSAKDGTTTKKRFSKAI